MSSNGFNWGYKKCEKFTLDLSIKTYSITQLCLTLFYYMDCSIPGFSVLHYLPEFAQTHVL